VKKENGIAGWYTSQLLELIRNGCKLSHLVDADDTTLCIRIYCCCTRICTECLLSSGLTMAHGVRLSIGFDFLQFNCPPVYASMFHLQGLKSLFLHKSEKFRLLSRIAMTVTSSFTTTHENPWVQILWFRHWTVSPQMSRRWKWIWWEQLSLENPSQGSAKTQGKSRFHKATWLVVWNMFYFRIYWECHRIPTDELIFFRGVETC
jgi:hypothetical protein